MKVYISADIEGTAGITDWDEARKTKPGYDIYAELMTQEVIAACEGAINAGADDIVIKDAHATGRNIYAEKLPRGTRLIRGWSGHPNSMIQEIDDTYDALVMTGYHSGASAGGNPLAHTISGADYKITLNGVVTSEYLLNRNAAALHGVPAVFISGDKLLCDTAPGIDPHIHTVATMHGIGGSTMAIHPGDARDQIRTTVEASLRDAKTMVSPPALDDRFEMEVFFDKHAAAYYASYYPGASSSGPHSVVFETTDFFDIMRMLNFVLK